MGLNSTSGFIYDKVNGSENKATIKNHGSSGPALMDYYQNSPHEIGSQSFLSQPLTQQVNSVRGGGKINLQNFQLDT